MYVAEKRLQKLKDEMAKKNVEAVVISKRENYIYFSGFNGTAATLLISPTERILFTDARYLEQAAFQAPLFEIVDIKGKLLEAMTERIAKMGIASIGIESSFVSYDTYKKYQDQGLAKELVPLGNEIDKIRAVKDDVEIGIIKKAVELADNAFAHVLQYIKPGVRELEIAAEIEYYLKRNGARGPSFDTIVASGKRSSLPHGVASTKAIEGGDSIIIDFGAIYEDYCSDMTRTVFLGKPQEEMVKIYNIVKEAQETAADKVVCGMTGKETDGIARKIIEGYGYGEQFGHGLGHGVGIEIHEEPGVSSRSETVLQNNMIITIEPGIYIPELGGVRIEDMLVVGDGKAQTLTRSSKEIMIL